MLIIVYEKNWDIYIGTSAARIATTKPCVDCKLWVAKIYVPKPDDNVMTKAPT